MKNAELGHDFESVENVAKKLLEKVKRGPRTI
jgi:hypothetical protein